jgi:predicted RNA-binding protein with PUA-like domain
MHYWLMKTEPSTFGLEDLKRSPRRTTMWDGVRNYQARNMLRDEFRKGDLAFFYHSSCDEPGIVAIVEVLCAGYPDPTAFMRSHKYHDPRSRPEEPRWYTVDVKLKRELPRPIGLARLRREPALCELKILQRGNRLSITPVTPAEWACIIALK